MENSRDQFAPTFAASEIDRIVKGEREDELLRPVVQVDTSTQGFQFFAQRSMSSYSTFWDESSTSDAASRSCATTKNDAEPLAMPLGRVELVKVEEEIMNAIQQGPNQASRKVLVSNFDTLVRLFQAHRASGNLALLLASCALWHSEAMYPSPSENDLVHRALDAIESVRIVGSAYSLSLGLLTWKETFLARDGEDYDRLSQRVWDCFERMEASKDAVLSAEGAYLPPGNLFRETFRYFDSLRKDRCDDRLVREVGSLILLGCEWQRIGTDWRPDGTGVNAITRWWLQKALVPLLLFLNLDVSVRLPISFEEFANRTPQLKWTIFPPPVASEERGVLASEDDDYFQGWEN